MENLATILERINETIISSLPASGSKQRINALIATPQSDPYAGAGGLAPFILEYTEAMITALGPPAVDVRVVIPYYTKAGKYKGFDPAREGIENFAPVGLTIQTDVRDATGQFYDVTVERASGRTRGGAAVTYYAIRCDRLFSSGMFHRIPEKVGAKQEDIDAAHNDAIKFAVFSNAVVKLLIDPQGQNMLGDWFPDIIHCHDWPTGLIPAYLATLYNVPNQWAPHQKPKTLFTFHLCPPGDGAQGVFTQANSNWTADDLLRVCGWDAGIADPVYSGTPNLQHCCNPTVWINYHPDWSQLNCGVSFLKGGLAFSDEANTVSPGYAEEMKDPPHSYGNEDTICDKASLGKWHGIRNGFDWTRYDPEIDEYLIAPYNQRNQEMVKRYNKGELFNHPGRGIDSRLQKLSMRLALSQKSSQYPRSLDANAIKSPSFDWRDNFILNYRSFRIDEDSFLAVLSARLVPQKGIDIALAPMCKLLKQYDKLRLIVMGRFQKTKETQHLAPMIQKLATKFPEKFMFINWFDRDENPIWERLLMAADIFLMPSRTEPCGIAQQRALHYGDIVIASEVGGLSPVPGNTIIRLDPTFIITTPTPVPPNANAISFPLSHPANICSREFRDAVAGFKEAISKAYEIWQNNRPLWETMVDNAMSFENGWDDPIGEYKGIYERLDP